MLHRAHFRVTIGVVLSSLAVLRLDAMRNMHASSASFVCALILDRVSMIPLGLFNAQQVARNQDKHVGMRKSVKRDDLPMPLHYDLNNNQ